MSCAPVEAFIHQSYLMFPNGELDLAGAKMTVEKGPAWMYSDLYRIEAKAEEVSGAAVPGQGIMMGAMLRALLEDRFKLRVHRESRPVPGYALVAAKDGPRLTPTPEGSCAVQNVDQPIAPPAPGQTRLPFCGLPVNGYNFRGTTMVQLSTWLSLWADRKVADKTGIAGRFDIPLDLSGSGLPSGPQPPPPAPGAAAPPPPPAPPPPSDPGDLTAAIQKALKKFGLQLDSIQGAQEFLVVDHVERPPDN